MSFEAIRARLTAGVPFAAHCGVSLDKLDRGSATATLPFRKAGLNHIGTQHAGALFAVGEAASGAAMAGLFADVLGRVRPVAGEATIRYLKPAKGMYGPKRRPGESRRDFCDRSGMREESRFQSPSNCSTVRAAKSWPR